jgi:hypothetical protein
MGEPPYKGNWLKGEGLLPRVLYTQIDPGYPLEGINVVAKRRAIPIKTALTPAEAANSPARAGTIN